MSSYSQQDYDQLSITSRLVWKDEKYKGVRSLQRITRCIQQKFLHNLIESQNRDAHEEENRLKTHEKLVNSKINEFFFEKLDKKYPKKTQSLLETEEDVVGFALKFNCEKTFFEEKFGDLNENSEKVSQQILKNLPSKGTEEHSKLIDQFNKKIKQTEDYIIHIKRIFDLDIQGKEFVRGYLHRQSKINSENLKKNDPLRNVFYIQNKEELADFNLEKISDKHKKFVKGLFVEFEYFEFNFEDFIVSFSRFVSFFTGLTIRIVPDIDCAVYLKLFNPKIKQIQGLAEAFEYEMQLKNYGKKYLSVLAELKKDDNNNKNDNETNLLIDRNYQTSQFHELDQDDHTNFPPFAVFETEKSQKFRKYELNDDFFDDPNDEEYQGKILSKKKTLGSTEKPIFRNIDKIRLMYMAFDNIIKIRKLKSFNYLDSTIIIRNFPAYQEKLEYDNLVKDKANIFNGKKQNEFIQTIRNFYGEKIAFYFLWISNYSIWLLFPSILGLAVFICQILYNTGKYLQRPLDSNGKPVWIGAIDVVYLSFSFLLVTWASLFIKVWKQNEKKYSCFWGMENYSSTEPFDDNFNRDYNEEFLFGYRIPYQSSVKKFFRYAASWTIVIIFIIIVLGLLGYLLSLKDNFANQEAQNKLTSGKDVAFFQKRSFWIGILISVQIKVFSFIYAFVVVWLTDWENHEKISKYDQSFTIKKVLFEFINNYAVLYYIAFIRESSFVGGKCNGTCWSELSMQLYIQFFIIAAVNIVELGLPFLMYNYHKKKLVEKYPANKELDFTPHSIHHQIITEEYSTVRDDYIEVIINFGYLVFFSIVAPLAPLIIFILTVAERFVDLYKLFYLLRVTIIDGSSGIGIYNKIFRIFYYIGMVTNIGLVLFTNPNFKATRTSVKLIIFLVVQNIFLILSSLFDFNILPQWFQFKYLTPILYEKKFYNKDSYSLPHHELKNKLEN